MNWKSIALVVCALGVAGTVSAGDPWEAQCRIQLKTVGAFLEEEGFTATHKLYLGELYHGQADELRLNMDKGSEYALIGVCDEDCSDLDLRVSTLNGEIIDTDVEVDDYPVVKVWVTGTGEFRLEVGMADCSAEPCSYGIGVYAR